MRRDIHSILIGFLIVSASVCLFLGLTLPVIRLTRLYVWTDTFSITSVIWTLFQDGEVWLSAILFIFSIIFPALKLLYLLAHFAMPGSSDSKRAGNLARLAWLGKWSMLDVLVLALVIFYVKSSGVADAVALPGIYFFAASVILTMITSSQIQKIS